MRLQEIYYEKILNKIIFGACISIKRETNPGEYWSHIEIKA